MDGVGTLEPLKQLSGKSTNLIHNRSPTLGTRFLGHFKEVALLALVAQLLFPAAARRSS
jgi:hypothetical protein